MALARVLVLVLAGGAGSRLELLTEKRAKAAVPFAGRYRLVDFPLSNCQHSHCSDVWVSMQFNPTSLATHLANGRPWDLDRTTGGLMPLQPFRGEGREGWHTGTADSLWRNAPLIRSYEPDALVVLSADAVYRLDYREVVDAHLSSSAAATLVTTTVPEDEASRYGVVRVGGDERITGYELKPDEPDGDVVSNEVFVLDPERVLSRLEELAAAAGDEGLDDLGHELLPSLVSAGLARAYPFDGYWRDVGTVEAYWQANQDFLRADPPFDLDAPGWPIHTRGGEHAAARVLASADVESSLLSGGTLVAGSVRGSVLSPRVVVEEGAVVEDSVLLPGVRVRSGARVRRAVVDDGVDIGCDATIGGDGDLTLVGGESRLEDGTSIVAGGRHPEPQRGR